MTASQHNFALIKMQLAAVAKRIESSRALLEEAKSRVDEIRLAVKRDAAMLSQSSNTRESQVTAIDTQSTKFAYTILIPLLFQKMLTNQSRRNSLEPAFRRSK